VASATVHEGASRRSAPGGGLVRRHPVPAFFVLAYLLSWLYWLVVLGIMGRDTLGWFVPGAFGPPLAALIVTGLVYGRDGTRVFLRRWVLWRVGRGGMCWRSSAFRRWDSSSGCPSGTGASGSRGGARRWS
jgi:hypothetical protein